MKTIKTLLLDRRVQLLIIAFITFLAFSNSLQNKLVWDDHLLLQGWEDIRSFNHIPEILQGSAPETFGNIYRPIRGLFYVFDYALWKDNPFFYHLQALLVHIGVTLVIYLILEKMFKKKTLIFFGALIFGVHTIHTEQVDYIAASMDSFGILFFFISFYFYILKDNFEKEESQKYIILCLIFAFLAIFTYELTVTLPLFFILYDLYFQKDKIKNALEDKLLIKTYGPFFIPLLVFLFLRIGVFHMFARTDYLGYSFYLTMLVMVKVFVQYIGLLFLPINLTANHAVVGNFPVTMLPYDKLDPVLNQSILDPAVLFSIGVLAGLGILAVFLYKKIPVVSFCIVWFFLSLGPVSYVIPSGGSMAERYLYIGSFGFIVSIIFILLRLAKGSFAGKNLVIIFLCFVTLFYFLGTFERNKVWYDDITLFTDMDQKLPGNLKADYSLGIWYTNNKDLKNAAYYYKKAINRAPDFWEARFNLANIYSITGQKELAFSELSKVLQFNPSFFPAIEVLKNLETAKSKNVVSDKLLEYTFNNKVSFSYPSSFELVKTTSEVILKSKTADFAVFLNSRDISDVSATDYINNQKITYGSLKEQGLAKVPNVDYAYARVWVLNNSLQMSQFFLFLDNKVVEIKTLPSNSPQMEEFNQIISSIKVK